MDLKERFDALVSRRPKLVAETAPRPTPRPDAIESMALESWAQDKDTRIHYVARLDRIITEGESTVRMTIGDSDSLRFLLGRLDALREERAWILKTAGLANRPPQGE